MAGQSGPNDSDDEYHSLSGHEPEDGEDDESEGLLEPPTHPVPSMQSAFEESIFESTADEDAPSSPVEKSAEERRQKLLESKQYDDAWTTRWKQRPAAKHHPLQKLMAQIVFGLHLLHQQQAKSDHEVVKILQTHVNEVDSFLERTSEDFDLAIKDIEERIRYLRLPMTHLDVFNVMLDDKKFRAQLLEGNDKIEKIIERTFRAMNAALHDVRQGLEANKELGTYLDSVQDGWPKESRGIADVFGAMRGNEQGWERYLCDLKGKGKSLATALTQLGEVIADIAKMAASASRRNKTQSRAVSSQTSKSAPASPGLHSKFSSNARDAPEMPVMRRPSYLNKPLPSEPGKRSGTATPKPHPVPFEQRYESPRESPQSPPTKMSRSSTVATGERVRPKTATSTPGEARTDSRTSTAELASFFKHSNPLRSNPPDRQADTSGSRLLSKRTSRSQSHGAATLLNGTSSSATNFTLSRSHSRRAADVLDSSQKTAKDDGPQRSDSKDVRESGSDHRIGNSVGAANHTKSVPAKKEPLPSAYNSLRRTGFARRLSARVKHLPPPEETPQDSEEKAIQNDSAYASGSDGRKGSSPENKPVEQNRPSSRLGLFPKADQPSTPSRNNATATGNKIDGTPSTSFSTPSALSVASKPESRSNKSLRNFFHRRDKSRKVTV